MISSTLYFSPQLAPWIEPFSTLLSTCGHSVKWQRVQNINQSPVFSIVLLEENDISEQDWPFLPSRKTIVIIDSWSLKSSVQWIKRGAANCFARDDERLVAWLVSELSQFPIHRAPKAEEDILQVIIDAIPAPIFFKDKLHIYQGCNTAFCQSLGVPREKVIGYSVYDVAPKHLADTYYKVDTQLLNQGGAQRYEADVQFSDGSIHEIEFNKAVFKKSNGEALGLVGVMLDITERNQLMRKLDKITRLDPLTGISNRREFDFIIHDELAQQKQSGKKLSLMTLDVDFFKKINDRFGHSGGDLALQLIADWLQSEIRSEDTVFRVGGEEFYILMRDTTIETALKLAEQLCKGMATRTFAINQQEIHITMSVGVIELLPTQDLEDTLNIVDKALYKAKSDGRNGVCPVYQ